MIKNNLILLVKRLFKQYETNITKQVLKKKAFIVFLEYLEEHDFFIDYFAAYFINNPNASLNDFIRMINIISPMDYMMLGKPMDIEAQIRYYLLEHEYRNYIRDNHLNII